METDEKEKVDFSELVDERQIALRAPLSPSVACMMMCAFTWGEFSQAGESKAGLVNPHTL